MPAEQETKFVPTGNELPDGGSHSTHASPPHTFVAGTVNVTMATPLASASATMGVVGQAHCRHSGPQSPSTVTGNVRFDWLVRASTAVHVTMVVPKGNTLPEGGEQMRLGAGSQLSIAVAL